MGIYATIAEAFRYPFPGLLDSLRAAEGGLPEGASKKALAAFRKEIQALTLAQWEELYTRTLDLNPQVAPYVGFQIWGESYGRGEFMAKLNRALYEQGVDLAGELPDHLLPALRYLDCAPVPLPELIDALPKAVERMAQLLSKAEAGNPYLYLFKALQAAL